MPSSFIRSTSATPSLNALADYDNFSSLQKLRLVAEPCLPIALRGPVQVTEDQNVTVLFPTDSEKLAQLFPSTWGQPVLQLFPDPNRMAWDSHQPLRLGVVLSGGEIQTFPTAE